MGLDDLNKRWEAAAARPIVLEMSFDGDFLVLGAQTRLAKVERAARNPTADTARLQALLAAAHGRPIAASGLRHIQRALQNKRDGEKALALVHLALSGLAKLREPKEDARRLFMADALVSEGFDASVIAKELDLDLASSGEGFGKYCPRSLSK